MLKTSEETKELLSKYDYEETESIYKVPFIEIPSTENWNVCVVLGQSGTGKTTTLRNFAPEYREIEFDNTPVLEFGGDIEKTSEMFRRCGFSSIPSWNLPYEKLSNGEKYRVQIAYKIMRDDPVIILDEFGSYLDSLSAIFLAKLINKLSSEKKFLIATLNPDLVDNINFDVLLQTGTPMTRGYLRRDRNIQIQRCHYNAWEIFKNHHYMNDSVMKNTKCFLLFVDGEIVGFSSAIPFPVRQYKNAYREHRTVILPNYQGLGLGVLLSDLVASIALSNEKIYFSKTVHKSLGEYRESSDKWIPTAENKKYRKNLTGRTRSDSFYSGKARMSYCHRYTGEENEALKDLWDDNPEKIVKRK